jgi:Protein of unknown function (DUF1194)
MQAMAQLRDVDLALILAIDCSFSVEASEYRLQMQGTGEALQSSAVINAIQSGPKQKIALLVMLWSDQDNQRIVLPWTTIANAADAVRLGKQLENQMRVLAEGGTATTSALLFAGYQFGAAPPSTRRVVDLSTDGRNNMGAPVRLARDALLAQGITINGLAVANEFGGLGAYVESQIAGGQGAFVITAKTYDDFGAAMEKKLVREILGPGTT